MKHRGLLCLVLIAAAVFVGTPLRADERILLYRSDIQVLESGEMNVTETIRVRSEGQQIRRGIYRDFPTRYKDRLGNHYVVAFEPLSALRNGASEPWHTEKRDNGVRVYFGSRNRTLQPGIHEYEFSYRTHRQLGFFENHDELYWNVTGNGWAFAIDRAEANVTLPFALNDETTELSAFTGHFGSTESAAGMAIGGNGSAGFYSTRELQASEGLAIVVTWPKGLITEPSGRQKAAWFLNDNSAALILSLAYLLVLGWYLWAWNKVGRDPQKGIIIPRYEPPTGLSPAASRYVLSMGFRQQSFIAALISLAVKGHLVIEEQKKEFTLRAQESETGLVPTAGEQAVLDELLPTKASSIEMIQKNHKSFAAARQGLHKALKKEFKDRMFKLNGIYLALPIVVSIVAVLLSIAFSGGPLAWIVYLVLVVFTHILFGILMRAPTPSGRQVMNEIEGLKMYLDTAEQDRLDRMRSPQMTPEVFETFLPYAYALGVENNWCNRFAREMPRDPGNKYSTHYNPGWYHGNMHGLHTLNHLGDNFSSSFSSAISSASSAPGSSSGSGGGGFSGGGGGGGGGGGW